jgi:hypothetical protein
MPELTNDVADALKYFMGYALRANAPASEQMIRDAEERLGLVFPPSMREFLQVHNGIGLIDCRILSVPPPGIAEGIVEETLYCREAWDEDRWIAAARDSSGDVYVVLADRADERGEHPVAKIDHETGNIMFIVASCYERFVWFLLDRLQREFEPNGDSMGLWESAEEDEEEWEEPSFPWPYGDREWMIQQDPHLARWLDGNDSSNSTK